MNRAYEVSVWRGDNRGWTVYSELWSTAKLAVADVRRQIPRFVPGVSVPARIKFTKTGNSRTRPQSSRRRFWSMTVNDAAFGTKAHQDRVVICVSEKRFL